MGAHGEIERGVHSGVLAFVRLVSVDIAAGTRTAKGLHTCVAVGRGAGTLQDDRARRIDMDDGWGGVVHQGGGCGAPARN